MNRQRFHIPMPDEKTIHMQIEKIVDRGLKRNLSFYAYLKQMYRQIGFKYLFSDRSEFVFSLLTVITFLCVYVFIAQPSQHQLQSLYGFIYMCSPVLFLVLSLYTYIYKIMNNTIEVEITYKYSMYQIIGFRMLIYSVIAILFNALLIFSLSVFYAEVQFFRAFMISNTGLFTFSVFHLYSMKKRRSATMAGFMIAGWILANLIFMVADHQLYRDILVNMPLFVYVIVLAVVFYFNFKSLKGLFIPKHAKGVY